MWSGEAKRRGCCRSFFVDTHRYAAQRRTRGREREGGERGGGGEREREREREREPELEGGEGWNVGV